LTGIEMRGPDYRNFSAGGSKTLFRLPGGPGRLTRVAVCESAIDALSLAAIECVRCDTLYAATAGGMGPATIAALQQILQVLAFNPAAMLIGATDADTAGRRYAARLEDLVTEAGVRFDAILPPNGLNDWNDALRAWMPVP
jgi:Toprim-like